MKRSLLLAIILIASAGRDTTAQEWVVYTTGNSELPGGRVMSLATDAQGTVWAGTDGDGVGVLRGADWTSHTAASDGLPSDYVNALAVEADGDAWIGTSGGLVRYAGGSFDVFTDDNSELPANQVLSAASDGDVIWIGSAGGFSGGLARIEGDDWDTYTISSPLPDYVVQAIAADGDGGVWIGTRSGVTKFDGTTFTTYNTTNSELPADEILSLAVDGNGRIWIGTAEGLSSFDGNAWTNFNTANSDLPNDLVGALAIDHNDDVWLGTGTEFFGQEGSGIARFDGSTWTTFNTSNSELPGNTVFAISIDSGGNKWIGTDSGLAAYRAGGVISVASEDLATVPTDFRLMQNYPNPFNPSTMIAFNLNAPSYVQIDVVDLLGRYAAILIDGPRPGGPHTVEFDGTGFPSGTYVYRLKVTGSDGRVHTTARSMVLNK